MVYEIELWEENGQMVQETWQKLSDVIRRIGELMDAYGIKEARPVRKGSRLEIWAPGKRIVVSSTEDPEFEYFIDFLTS